jgi:hypothetical protein
MRAMAWTKLGNISPLHSGVTVVAGDIAVMTGWPGAEAAGYPDDAYELATGTVSLFDLSLLSPTVFTNGNCVRLIASPDGKGTGNVDDATVAEVLGTAVPLEPGWSFDVAHGAMVLSCADCATPAEGAKAEDSNQPSIPKTAPPEASRRGKTMVVLPCDNGVYLVSEPTKVEAKHRTFDFLLQINIWRAESD